MKEYTIIHTVQITEIIPIEDNIPEELVMDITTQEFANELKEMTGVDDVVVLDKQVFISKEVTKA
jgi:hypothetical protein